MRIEGCRVVGAADPYGSNLGLITLTFYKIGSDTVRVRVRVALRPTVSRPVRLGVKPILGLLTRNLFSSEV
jgi:hypothetical protein